MTDAELIKMLRSSANRVVNYAGDRIETLTLERDVMARAIAHIFDKYGLELLDTTDQRTEDN